MKKLVLFDIDGTLVDTAGSGSRAFSAAMSDVLGISDGLDGIRLDGQTDLLILELALERARFNEALNEATTARIYERYVELLEEELSRNRSNYRVLDGVYELLDVLSKDPGTVLGLATGNLEKGAWAKLRPGGLDKYFRFGGFGSDSRDRSELIATAIKRGISGFGLLVGAPSFVIGDTPNDIIHGRKAGAKVIAVASGRYSGWELSKHDPDLLMSSLLSYWTVLEFIGNHA